MADARRNEIAALVRKTRDLAREARRVQFTAYLVAEELERCLGKLRSGPRRSPRTKPAASERTKGGGPPFGGA